MTKKGRTAMTAFAGSIGIIGIAAILALSNGVNDYIARVEQDTLSSYPLSIAKQSYDMSGMLTGDDTSSRDAGDVTDASSVDASQPIPEATVLRDMFASVKSNDMTSFKSWLDAGGDGLASDVSAIQYDYGITPIVYRENGDGADPTKLVPNSMTQVYGGGASSAAMAGTMMSSSASAFSEMLDDQSLLDSQYDVVAGRWASAPDEAVLVLSRSGKVSDYTLYSIGVLDIDEMNDLVSSAMSADGDVTTPDTDVNFTYDDALNTSFKVLSPSDAYRRNDETGGWTDMSGDADFMAAQVAGGLDLKIVGVVRPNGSSNANALQSGVNYTHGLTEELMARAASSRIPTSTCSRARRSTSWPMRASGAWTCRACSPSTRRRSGAPSRSIPRRSTCRASTWEAWTWAAWTSTCRGWRVALTSTRSWPGLPRRTCPAPSTARSRPSSSSSSRPAPRSG